MEIVEQLKKDNTYQDCIQKIEKKEQHRLFCKHGFQHGIDVYELALCISRKKKCNIPERIIAGAALLHDLGRSVELTEKISHDKASVAFAREILLHYFDNEEIEQILDAIAHHSGRISQIEIKRLLDDETFVPDLRWILKISDQMSRPCFQCDLCWQCKWKLEDRNQRSWKEYFEEE